MTVGPAGETRTDAKPAIVGILLDATAVPLDRGGVGRYVDALVAALETPFYLACQARDADYYASIAPAAVILPQSRRLESTAVRFAWEQLVLPVIAARHRVGVVHSPHYTMPLFSRAKQIVTFHDATFMSDPSVHSPLKRSFFSSWIKVSSRLADAVIVPSYSAASELARYVKRPAAGFDVAHHGVDSSIFHVPGAEEISEMSSATGLDGRGWIAFLGTLEPRKNLPALITAYAQLARGAESADETPFPRLAIAGGAGWETGITEAVSQVSRPGQVMLLGFIPTNRIRAFLGGSLFVAYPSLGEGFGLPVLEGMASGAPVLTTRMLAIPEVGGDAVEYTDTNSSAIEIAMKSLISDEGRRRVLAARGIERAALFTWRNSAIIHEAVYSRFIPPVVEETAAA
ncbi:MAG: glycosyltransferase family 4 protein [Candidatus Saccharibacteria bacterium]|nr:glycosyltransferase family 4 protein [Microbacteriaceae bacterium]